MHIPDDQKLPIRTLAACFSNTTTTYKFYWFLSVLQAVEIGDTRISKKELFARMIASAWYTVNYFHVSFGKQDLIQNALLKLKDIEALSIDEKSVNIINKVAASKNQESEKLLWHFDRNVPHWFLSPWYPKYTSETESMRTKRIYQESQALINNPLYVLYEEYIEINPSWLGYIKENCKILKEYCYWNLTLFLQSKNPNVPDISGKLIKPPIRTSLIKQKKQFWDIVFNELNLVECIYTKKQLHVNEYAIDHFIPFNFVSHDLIWNLIPCDKIYNISKSDKLPILDIHFDAFYKLHSSAIKIVKYKSPNSKLLEEYFTIIPDLSELEKNKFRELMQSLISIASNNGFQFLN